MLNPQNTPQAKPVKIRIMSGGEEHSSLDSLLHHFDIEDVCSLLDGRLSRWLKGQNEQELAEYIESIENKDSYDDNQKLIIIKHFFAHEDLSKYSNLADVAELWSISDAFRYNGKSLYLYVVKTCDAEELLKIYEKKDDLPYINNWLDFFEQHKDEHNADVWYWYGVLSNQNSWIEKAAKDGSSLAKDYIQIEEKTAKVSNSRILQIINEFGDTLYYCQYYPQKNQYRSHSLSDFDSYNLNINEKEFVELLLDIQKVLIRRGCNYTGEPWSKIVESLFAKWKKSLSDTSSYLFYERVFLLQLFNNYAHNDSIIKSLQPYSEQKMNSPCFQYMHADGRMENPLKDILKYFINYLKSSFSCDVNANGDFPNLRTIKMRFGDSPYDPDRNMSLSLSNFKDLNLSDKEKTIIKFLIDLANIRKMEYQWDTFLKIYGNRWGKELEGESFLCQEKMFLLGLYAYYGSKTGTYSTILRKTCTKFGVSYNDIKEYEMVKRMSKHNYDAKGYYGIMQDFIEHFFQSYGV